MSEPNQLNPYQSPVTGDALIPGELEPRLGNFRPRIAPRDVIDVMIGLFVGVPSALLVYLIPLTVLAIFGAPWFLFPIAFLTVLTAAVLAVLSGIQKTIVTGQGIEAKRGILPRIELRWCDVTAIREVGRLEAYRGVFFVPYRSCAQTLTCRNHFRIETAKSYFLFPPRDVDEFRATVHSLWSEANVVDSLRESNRSTRGAS